MKAFLLLTIAVCVYGQTPCDNIRTRTQWGARTSELSWMADQPPSGFAIHHTGGTRCTSTAACDTMMRNLQDRHMDEEGLADVSFNFCIGDIGVVYQGRGYGRIGAHAPGFNNRALGFCFFGDYTASVPTLLALNNAQMFIICSRDRGYLTGGHWVSTHRGDRESETECPGQGLHNQIMTWPRFIEHP